MILCMKGRYTRLATQFPPVEEELFNLISTKLTRKAGLHYVIPMGLTASVRSLKVVGADAVGM